MIWTFKDLMSAVRDTLFSPEHVARALLSSRLSHSSRYQIALLVAIFGTAVTLVSTLVASATLDVNMGFIATFSPVIIFVGVFVQILIAAFLVRFLGGLFGGVGTFSDSLLAVSWIEVVLGIVRLAVLLITTALPFMTQSLTMVLGGLYVWLLSHFVMQMHGFSSFWKVFLVIFAALLTVGIVVGGLIEGLMAALPVGG